MPSFDIVSKVDGQTLDNAINNAKKEIINRYDFHDSKTEIDLDKKTNTINILTENEMRVKAIQDVVISRMIKQHLDANCLDFGKDEYASGNMVRKEIKVKEGIDKEVAKKIVKKIKDSGEKVQASIMDEQVRVTGKKIDDLQKQINELKAMIVSNQSSVNSQQSISFSSASLEQNIPNPFTHTTNIGYSLNQKFTTAQIVITDKNGKTIKAINVSGSGKGSLNVDASTLASGAYQYSLLINGKLIGTKQMVLAR